MKLGELAEDKTRKTLKDQCVQDYDPQDHGQRDAYRSGFDKAYGIWSKAFLDFQERMKGG